MYENHKLTRKGMEQIVQGGGSVLHKGQLFTTVAQLPTEAELAKGNPLAERAAEQDLKRRLAETQAELDKLKAATKTEEPKK